MHVESGGDGEVWDFIDNTICTFPFDWGFSSYEECDMSSWDLYEACAYEVNFDDWMLGEYQYCYDNLYWRFTEVWNYFDQDVAWFCDNAEMFVPSIPG